MAEKKKTYSTDFLRKVLYDLILIRIFEEKTAQMYGIRKIGGFCHLYIGQEAVAVGSIAALDMKKDYILTSYRDHAHALAIGMSADSIMAELYGKATGCSKGKGGSMHLFDVEGHFFGGNGIVASQVPVATGIAFKQKYNKEDGVTLCYLGDGAFHQGAMHESLNLAVIWKLPVIFIVENNAYGMGTAVSRISGMKSFEDIADPYGIRGMKVDGMDFFEVYEKTKEAVAHVRKKQEPLVMNIQTYRYRGHSMSDPGKYRSKEEVEEYKKLDPIYKLQDYVIKNNILKKEECKAMEEEIKIIVDRSVDFAENSPEPALESLYEDVLAEGVAHV